MTTGGSREAAAILPANVTIVTREEMSENGWRSVSDVLQNTPGFYVTSDGSLTSVGVRGVTGGLQTGTRLVKLMINGTDVGFRPELRSFLGREYIPVEAIEQIEIVRGPLSSVHGANAPVATVNVITREIPAGPGGSAAAQLLSQNRNRPGYGGSGAISYGGELAKLLIAVTAHSLDRSRLSVQRTFPSQNPNLPRYAPLFAEASRDDRSAPAGVFFQLVVPSRSAGTLTLDGGLQNLDANTEFRVNSVLTHQSRESLLNTWVNLRHENHWTDAIASQIDVGFSAGAPTRDDQLYLTGVFDQRFTRNFGYRALDGSAFVAFTPSSKFSFRIGFDADVEFQDVLFYTVTFAANQGNRAAGESVALVDANVDTTQTLSTRALFLELSGQPLPMLPGLHLTGNLRLDRLSYGSYDPPTQLSARAAAVYEWNPWLSTKLVAGRGFHAPSGVLMFAQSGFGISNNLIGSQAPTSGVPPLKPQRFDSVEGIVSLSLWNAALLEVAVFHQQVQDSIEFAAAGFDFVARNSGKQQMNGAEATLRTDFGPINPFGSAAWISPDREPLVAYPKFVATGGIALDLFEKPRLNLSGRVRHVSSRAATLSNQALNANAPYALPAYRTVDVTLSTTGLALLGPEADTHLYFSAQNLLDQRNSEAGFVGFDVPALGRTAFFEVRQSF